MVAVEKEFLAGELGLEVDDPPSVRKAVDDGVECPAVPGFSDGRIYGLGSYSLGRLAPEDVEAISGCPVSRSISSLLFRLPGSNELRAPLTTIAGVMPKWSLPRLLRLRKKNQAIRAAAIRNTMAPMTPPAIAPELLEPELEPAVLVAAEAVDDGELLFKQLVSSDLATTLTSEAPPFRPLESFIKKTTEVPFAKSAVQS